MRSRASAAGLVERVRIVLLAAGGQSNAAIGRALGCTENTVRKWKERFRCRPKLASLRDHARTGRPPSVPMFVRLELIKLACKRPADCKLPFRSVWTIDALRTELARATRFVLSQTEIRRVLAFEAIRPHHIRLWLHSPDPEFRPKVRAICNLYVTPPAAGDTVLCIDEKTGMQALEHKYPFKVPSRGKPGRREFEYKRHGTVNVLVFFVVHSGQMEAVCVAEKNAAHYIQELRHFRRRHRGLKGVYLVHDGDPSHTAGATQDYLEEFRNWWHPRQTPAHASWLNQAESLLEAFGYHYLDRASWRDREQFKDHIAVAWPEYNRLYAHPFKWEWSIQEMKKWFAKHAP